jgi:hypothetical protein
MKTILGFIAILLTIAVAAGCSKKSATIIKPSDVSVTSIATGAKTKSGKPVDVYEVQVGKNSAIVLIIGGGKLATSNPALLALDGQMLPVSRETMNNSVLLLDKKLPVFIPIPNVTPADVKGKCTANSVIDLPIDETLAAQAAAMPIMPGYPSK